MPLELWAGQNKSYPNPDLIFPEFSVFDFPFRVMTMALAVTPQENVGGRFGWLPLEELFNKLSRPKTPIMTLSPTKQREWG